MAALTDRHRYWAMPGIVALLAAAAASRHTSAPLVGTEMAAGPVLASVEYRWGAIAAAPMALVVPATLFGAPPETAFVALALSLVGLAVFATEARRGRRAPTARPDRRTVALARAIEGAFVHDEVELHLQPIVRADDWSVVGFESLVRWQSPRLGAVTPDELLLAARWQARSPGSSEPS
ncbi:MAG: EAL domain-containing protein [Ilumatobacteraceae bacterium]